MAAYGSGRPWLCWTSVGGYRYRNIQDDTPLDLGWERKVYERVLSPIWPLLTDGIAPVRPDGRLPADPVLARLPAALEALADATSWQDQETFLETMRRALDILPVDCVGPIEQECSCDYCRQAAEAQREEARMPRQLRLREMFIENLDWQVQVVLETPNAYDRKHGAPRLFWRRARQSKGGQHAT